MLLNKMLRSKVQGTQSLITSILNKVQSDLNLVFFGKHPIEEPNVKSIQIILRTELCHNGRPRRQQQEIECNLCDVIENTQIN